MFATTSIKGLVAGAGAVAALVAPVVLAGPAQASTSRDGCTVTPGVPYFNNVWDPSGTKRVHRLVTVTCNANLRVETDSEFWEQDTLVREGDDEDDMIGEYTSNWTFPAGIGRTTQSVVLTRTLPQPPYDSDTSAEVYQRLRFRVTSGASGNGVQGSWTAFELTAPRTIFY